MSDTTNNPDSVRRHEALKPCPHCGGAAAIVSGAPCCHFVRCIDCKASSDDRSLDGAIAAWNRRASTDDLVQALELVRGIIGQAASTGFNWKDGDWAERLFASQAVTFAALSNHRRAGEK